MPLVGCEAKSSCFFFKALNSSLRNRFSISPYLSVNCKCKANEITPMEILHKMYSPEEVVVMVDIIRMLLV